jgi:hypothetical protein
VVRSDGAKCGVPSRFSRISKKAKKRENTSASQISEEANKREVGQNDHIVLDDNLVDRFRPLCL